MTNYKIMTTMMSGDDTKPYYYNQCNDDTQLH